MMQQNCCQHDCWLSRYFLTDVPYPRFSIGEIVVIDWKREETGEMVRYEGVVIGLHWNPPNSSSGWWYHISFHDLGEETPLSLPIVQDESESAITEACHHA